VIRVESESLPSRALQVEIRSAEVRGGEATELHIPVPMRQINFSQFGDASETCGTGTVSCDDD
jgi:hypothetical protein